MFPTGTPLVLLTSTSRDIFFGGVSGRWINQLSDLLSPVSLPAATMTFLVHTRDTEIIIPNLITFGAHPAKMLVLRTARARPRPRAPETHLSRSEVEQILVRAAPVIWCTITSTASPLVAVFLERFALPCIAGLCLTTVGHLQAEFGLQRGPDFGFANWVTWLNLALQLFCRHLQPSARTLRMRPTTKTTTIVGIYFSRADLRPDILSPHIASPGVHL